VRANERTDERATQYSNLYSCLFWPTVQYTISPPFSPCVRDSVSIVHESFETIPPKQISVLAFLHANEHFAIVIGFPVFDTERI